jgi:hypothetical protein
MTGWLWAALLVTQLPRDHALSIFRALAHYIHSLPEKQRFSDIRHSGLAKLPAERLKEAIKVIVASPTVATALTPLCLFENLPANEAWNEVLIQCKAKINLGVLGALHSKNAFSPKRRSNRLPMA